MPDTVAISGKAAAAHLQDFDALADRIGVAPLGSFVVMSAADLADLCGEDADLEGHAVADR